MERVSQRERERERECEREREKKIEVQRITRIKKTEETDVFLRVERGI